MSEEQDRSDQKRAARTGQGSEAGLVGEITAAWHEAKDAFAKSERRYRDLVEHSLGLICTHDLTGRLGSINPAAARSLGYEPEEGIGRNLVDFLAPETRHLFDGYLRRIRNHRQDAGLMRVIARDRTERVWMYRNVLIDEPDQPPYVLGHAIDITDRIHAERALREKEHALRRAHDDLEARVKERTSALETANERLRVEIAERQHAEELRERALIEQRDTLVFLATISEGLAPVLRFEQLLDVMRSLPVPFASDWTMVHVLAEDGAISSDAGRHVTPALEVALVDLARAASGVVPPDSLIRRAIDTAQPVIVADDSDKVRTALVGITGTGALLKDVGTGGVAVLPLIVHGGPKAALSLGVADGTRFRASGRIVVEDLAHRARLVADRIALYRDAQEASRVKDEFLSTLSHELRTPLNAVYGWARILRTRQLDKNTAHAVEVIERNAEAQVRMIEDVLDISRIITGKMRLAMESLDVCAVLRSTLDSVRPAMQAKRVRLEVQMADCPAVWADPNRLQQVFWNVLSNAVKFTGANGVVTVALRPLGDSVEIQVADTGVGIRRDVLPFVFDRFHQGESSTTRRHGGLGLGLAIVRQLVELHGGAVRADSGGEAHGATFTIRLPVDRRTDAARGEATAEAGAGDTSSPSLRGCKVLFVEDHEDARELVANVLATAGAEVFTAASTEEALRKLEHVAPDILLADLGLPDEDGYTLLKRIREMEGFAANALPAVALTAYARASDRERALSAGFLDFVVKPVDPAELVTLIQAVCEMRR